MADLTSADKRKLERLFEMGGGYVLNFNDRSFQELVAEATGKDLYGGPYGFNGTSKAKHLRAFWAVEDNYTVAKLLEALIEYGNDYNAFAMEAALVEQCQAIIQRVRQTSPVPEIDAIKAISDEKAFEALIRQIKDAIERNEPATALDRLHTYLVKFVRQLCADHGIDAPRDKALHATFGEYVRLLHERGHLESGMARQILRSTIKTLEEFNHVRNTQSLAHDNQVLNHDEALLIFRHVTASIRFVRDLEARLHPQAGNQRTTDNEGTEA